MTNDQRFAVNAVRDSAERRIYFSHDVEIVLDLVEEQETKLNNIKSDLNDILLELNRVDDPTNAFVVEMVNSSLQLLEEK